MENQNNLISPDILDDLASRFIINVPEEERKDIVRICFQIELAHWFYLDFYCNKHSNNRKCTIKDFVYSMFKHIPFLNKYRKSAEETYEMWRQYKMSVPTFGAIILDQDLTHILLVQGFYSKCSWGFPKGKINEGEEWSRCAVREVLEETGFDISPYLNEQDFLEHVYNDQLIRLYVIPGVPRNTGFMPSTRCEIKSIQWFPVDQLPCTKKDTTPRDKMGLGANSFFMIIPFMRRIRLWIDNKKARVVNVKPLMAERKQQIPSGEQERKAIPKKASQIESQHAVKATKKASGKRILPITNSPPNFLKSRLRFDKNGTAIITAPSWTNFHFDRSALLKQLTS
ncbi:m7GpppN-mRNA hydrolase [Neocloeon triangulifer]|uniref:m7GpppN-mRNA hydrolase n=1 Tax=Neocloeon triangulifer TaxID=2078957 RepID=UPI00286F0DBC|nr:m7GpppN-mRNA hydrolase [Neocloeon triangulifer]XP_059479700.1 m7GpppN-mRNA hydrolase [Neocloeon triangulifer]